jgi:3'-phosphoadenosine 5'-phosphosulfate (PAPS) 3'-phosphatase
MLTTQHKGELFQRAICKAIQAERDATPASIELRLLGVSQKHTGCWIRVGQLGLAVTDTETALVDDRFDKAQVFWEGMNQTRKPVTVRLHPDKECELQLLGVTAVELQAVKTIELRCKDFLYPLKKAWQDSHWSAKAFDSYTRMSTPQKVANLNLSDEPGAQRLSRSQIGALNLVNQSTGYFWGPPGAGKTETGAVMLNTYLTAVPNAKILVLGIANFPVDQLLTRLDNLLRDNGRNDIRTQITRYGNGVGSDIRCHHFHLLPGDQDNFMASHIPLGEFSEIDFELEQFDAGLKSTRLFSMTIATATMKIEQLRSLAPFDLVLIEEASQAPLSQVLLFAPLAISMVFAGDPAQLAPVAVCQRPEMRRWMATSAFDYMPELTSPAVWMLTEQRRMAPSICALVSAIAYKNQLQTSPDCLNNKKWINHRHVPFGHYRADQTVIAHAVFQDLPRQTKQLVREESAQEILNLLQQDAGRNFEQKDIFVVTPFRAQARHLRRVLDSHHFNGVRVSTVHKTQGKEARVVIFDPVDGTHSFLKSKEALKLLTVAFSRAECKLLVILSERDLENPILRMVHVAAQR